MTQKQIAIKYLQMIRDFDYDESQYYDPGEVAAAALEELAGNTALDLISAERDKQISKGYTVEHDAKYVGETYIHFDQLAFGLMNRVYAPEGWDKKYWEELTKLPLKEKLAIAGSWIATELDIVLHKEKTEQ